MQNWTHVLAVCVCARALCVCAGKREQARTSQQQGKAGKYGGQNSLDAGTTHMNPNMHVQETWNGKHDCSKVQRGGGTYTKAQYGG